MLTNPEAKNETAALFIHALPCGCNQDDDCPTAAKLRQHPALARYLIKHRRALFPMYDRALKVLDSKSKA